MKKMTLICMASLATLSACGGSSKKGAGEDTLPKVYFTSEISPESLIRIYEALGVEARGNVAVKISTGEAGNTHYLKPEFIGDLVDKIGGTIVECNTAYMGKRNTTEDHWQTIRDHGFVPRFKVDLMDEEGSMDIPVQDTTHIKFDRVGTHLANYDFMVNLAHFKGHAMGGFGGVLKNASIGVASSAGKAYIHSWGNTFGMMELWDYVSNQDAFLESMAAAAQGVHDYFKARNGIVYINVMNNMSVDCDCDGHPAAPELLDMGIMASLDPVAVDQACLDMVFNHQAGEGDNEAALTERITSRHGTHTVDHAAAIGLGSKEYELVCIDGTEELAKLMIRTGQAECVLVKDGEIAATESGHGVSPLLEMYDKRAAEMEGSTIVDKVVGRAAASIAVCGKASHVHGELMSEDAVEVLSANGITSSYKQLVPRILNRDMDGLCPLEQSVEGITDPAAALTALRARVAELSGN